MAVVFCEVASEPASGSDKMPQLFHRLAKGLDTFFCSSDPNVSIPQHTNELFADITTEVDASTLEISSIAKTYDIVSIPALSYFDQPSYP